MSHIQIALLAFSLLSLVCLAAFFSFAETSMMAVNRYRLRHKARMKKRYAMRALKLLKRPDRMLGTILIGNTVANMLASSIATLIAMHFWGENGAILAAIVLTLIVMIFGEILPKTIAAIYADRIVRFTTYPIVFFLKLLYPLVWLANSVTNGILRLFRISITAHLQEPLSREELRSIVYDTTGKMSRQYQNMLLTILDLNKLTVDDVMVPRHDIVGIDIDLPWGAISSELSKARQDWVPFYKEQVNQIIGVFYMQDSLRMLLEKQVLTKEVLLAHLKEPYFVPEGTALNVQLSYFQQAPENKVAFVVDEYGEIQGLLTLNDILEEIVGDFSSTLGGAKQAFTALDDGSYLVDGAAMLREFNRKTGWDLPLSGPRTLNGLIVEHLEMLPRSGVCVLIHDYPIELLAVNDNRVKTAKILPRMKKQINE